MLLVLKLVEKKKNLLISILKRFGKMMEQWYIQSTLKFRFFKMVNHMVNQSEYIVHTIKMVTKLQN